MWGAKTSCNLNYFRGAYSIFLLIPWHVIMESEGELTELVIRTAKFIL